MRQYDQIGPRYREVRSSSIGVNEMVMFAKHFNRKISILDIGCGNGIPIAKKIIGFSYRYLGIDSSKVLGAEFGKNIPGADIQICKMEDMDLGGDQFDLVFAYGSIFHLQPEQQRAALAKAAKVVAPGGIFTFTSGRDPGSCEGNVGGVTVPHWSLGEKEYISFVEQCGLHYSGQEVDLGGNVFFVFGLT